MDKITDINNVAEWQAGREQKFGGRERKRNGGGRWTRTTIEIMRRRLAFRDELVVHTSLGLRL